MSTFNNNEYALTGGYLADLNATAGSVPATARFTVPFGGVVIARNIVLDGAFTTTAVVTGVKLNETAISGNSATCSVANSAAGFVFGGALAVPFEVKAGDCISITTTQAAGSAQSARCSFVIRR